jgi:hypothetical protein
MEAEQSDRLAGSIRTAVFAVLRDYGVAENPEVVRSVARAASRVTKAVLPAALAAAARREAGTAGGRPRRARGKRVPRGRRRRGGRP